VVGKGTATFNAVATPPPGGAPALPPVNKSADREMPAAIVITQHHTTQTVSTSYAGSSSRSDETKEYGAIYTLNSSGEPITVYQGSSIGKNSDSTGWSSEQDYGWSSMGESGHFTDNSGTDMTVDHFEDPFGAIKAVPDVSLTAIGWAGGSGGVGSYPPSYISHYKAAGSPNHWDNLDGVAGQTADSSASGQTQAKLYTGGKAQMKGNSLFEITASAVEYGKPTDPAWMHTPGRNVNPTSIQILGKSLGSDGKLWTVQPDGAESVATVIAPPKNYGALAEQQKYHPYITANGVNLENETPKFCAGQKVTFALAGIGFPSVFDIYDWTVSAKQRGLRHLF
jgi:hypothetical protein